MIATPEISVIVPVYNAGEYLAPCIESVLAQTFADFELILVDDASTDDSGEVCDSFNDPRIRVIHKGENGGVSAARNTGLAYARGNYVSFVDADDRIHPHFLEVTHKVSCDIVVSGLNIVNDLSIQFTDEICLPKFYEAKEAVEKTLYQTTLSNSVCGVLYNKKILDNFSFPANRYEDLGTFYQLFLRAKKIAYLSTQLYYYTNNPKSYMNVFTAERAVVLDVTERIVEYMRKNCPELTKAAEDRALSAAFNIFNLLAENHCDEPAIAERCKATIRRYRRQSLFNRKVRFKNKIGILATYLGGFGLLKKLAIWTK